MVSVGSHCLLELYGCPAGPLDDADFVRDALRRAAEEAGVTLLNEVSHRFHPQGITAIGLLAESHISIHTWPELGYAGADIFTCGDTAVPEKACEYLTRVFKPTRHHLRKIPRGPASAQASSAASAGLAEAASAQSAAMNPGAGVPAASNQEEGSGDGKDDPCQAPSYARTSG